MFGQGMARFARGSDFMFIFYDGVIVCNPFISCFVLFLILPYVKPAVEINNWHEKVKNIISHKPVVWSIKG